VTIATAIDEYLRYLDTVARRAPATIQAYRADLRKFAGFLGHARPLELTDIEPPTVERWMGEMSDLSVPTVRRALNALSGLFTWAVRYGYANANPLDAIERPRKRRRIQPCPTCEEVAALLGVTKGDAERAALLALATAGLRRAELLALSWPHINLPDRHMRIHGKGDKDRQVVIFDELLAALYPLRASQDFPDDGAVFRGRQGARLQNSTLQRWFTRWMQDAGLQSATDGGDGNHYTLHSLRRFAAKKWLDSGLNIRQVQLLLGHEDLKTTIRYLNYDFSELQQAAAAVDFGLGPNTTLF
jgi:integrase/recombinase XerC